jgi:hypothetical protein
MSAATRSVASIILGIVIACPIMPDAQAAVRKQSPHSAAAKPTPAKPTPAKPTVAKPDAAKGAQVHGPAPRGHQLKFRPARTAARADAARLGALVGNGCNGRSDMQRNEHQWIVLCSNGKTYVVESPAPKQPGAPAVECSLAGTGPLPACFP